MGIIALIYAINLYFVFTYLSKLPHPAYWGLVALLAVVYFGLTTYLVQSAGGAWEMGRSRMAWGEGKENTLWHPPGT